MPEFEHQLWSTFFGGNLTLKLAEKHKEKLDVVVSYPCYEYWLMLHFNRNRKPYAPAGGRSAGECLVADLQKQTGMEKYAKGASTSVFDQLKERLPKAFEHAEQVLDEALKNDAMNPSTRLHELLKKFDELGNVIPLA